MENNGEISPFFPLFFFLLYQLMLYLISCHLQVGFFGIGELVTFSLDFRNLRKMLYSNAEKYLE